MYAVILAGGRGTRINNITKKLPKPLIKFNKKDLLGIIIRNLAKYNFEKIIILAGYKGQLIKKKYHKKTYNFTSVECYIEKKSMDTWGAVILNKKKIKKNFILLNGDTYFNYDYNNIFSKKLNNDLKLIITNNHTYKENKKLINLNTTLNNKLYFDKKSKFINSGSYIIKRKFLEKFNLEKKSLENDVVTPLISQKEINAIKSKSFLIDIGTHKNLKIAKKKITTETSGPAVFLDRDGVINHDFGYVHKFKNFKFRKNVLKGLRFLSKKKIHIFIITNQAGVAKNKFTEKDFEILHKKLKAYLLKRNIIINDVSYCFFHPNAKIKKYNKISGFRKPGNLMIKNIFKNWEIVRKKSFMIGDKDSDRIAAKSSDLYFEFAKKDFFFQVQKICHLKKI